MARNRINTIDPRVANNLPNLTTLILTSNNLAELADLDVLGKFPRLTHLSLLENPVTRREVCMHISSTLHIQGEPTVLTYEPALLQHYRYWIVWRCPTIRFFDYQKVKDVERAKATDLFGTAKEPSALASKVRPSLKSSLPIPSLSPHHNHSSLTNILLRNLTDHGH